MLVSYFSYHSCFISINTHKAVAGVFWRQNSSASAVLNAECTLEEAGADTLGVSVFASSCLLSNQTSLMDGKCVQTSSLLLKPFRATWRGALKKTLNQYPIIANIYIHILIFIYLYAHIIINNHLEN